MNPTPQAIPDKSAIRAARKVAGLSQSGAAEIVYVSRRAWQKYEDGSNAMKLGLWELFRFKTGQLWVVPLQLAPKPKKPTRRPGRSENLTPFAAKSVRSHSNAAFDQT